MSSREDNVRKRAVRDILAYEDTLTADVERAIQRIREKAKRLHTELDRYINKLITDIKKTFDQELCRIREAVEILSVGNTQSLSRTPRTVAIEKAPRYRSTPRSSDLEASLNTTSLSAISKAELETGDHFETKDFKFFDGEVSDKLFKRLTGFYTLEVSNQISLTTVPSTTEPYIRSAVKLIRSFRVGDKSETVHAIAPVQEDQAWICCSWGSRNIALYDRNGQKKTSATLDIQINDATSFYDEKDEVILVSSYREKSIKRLNPESLRTSDFAYTSLFPGGLCSDRRGGIYVCFRDGYQRQAAFGSRRMIAKLSKYGEIVATMEKNKEQTNIFGYPFRIAVNTNGDICVSDYGDGTRGVTILQRDGTVKCWYKGQPATKASDQPFLPHGIVCDGNGYILVSDWNNDCVHVLDKDGNFMLYLVNAKDGLEGPNALGLDGRGYLWVGDSHGVVRIFKYEIFED